MAKYSRTIGNFSPSDIITSCKWLQRDFMQEFSPKTVPRPEAFNENAVPTDMNDPTGANDPLSSLVETDEQLMAAFARGSHDAFSVLFLRYKQPLFGFFRRRVADWSQAEELTQETFLAVLRASSRYQACALFRTYLYAIGFKILRAYRRKAAFRAMFPQGQTVDREPAAQNATDAELVVREAMGKLEHLDREILMLREFEQLSYAEIAGVLGLPLNTVRSRLFRARRSLHDLLAAPALQSSAREVAESEEHA
jgi:RNA polymerase sigma-70 factor (ECF subfamily)